MVVEGIGAQDYDVEIITLDPVNNPVPQCIGSSSALKFPVSVYDAGGAAINSIPTVCGGYQDNKISDVCFQYNYQNSSWDMSGQMNIPRRSSGWAYSNSWGLVATGGYSRLSSSEYTTDGGTFRSLKALPNGFEEHCIAVVNDTTLFLAGGRSNSGSYRSEAYLYNRVTEQWSQVNRLMTTGRQWHACAAITNMTTGEREVVVSGGYNNSGELYSVEIYSVARNQWREGRDLPIPIRYSSAVTPSNFYSSYFYLVGGLSNSLNLDNVYRYDAVSEKGEWTLMSSRLNTGRYRTTAMMLDGSDFPSCT
jgi:hypothetical protein